MASFPSPQPSQHGDDGRGDAADVVRGSLEFSTEHPERRLTHYLFRYPAKFHPPVVRQLILDHTEPDDTIYDPFCGSGTLMIEAVVAGRHAIGTDVDPVAVFVSSVKGHAIVADDLKRDLAIIQQRLLPHRRSAATYERFKFEDISDDELDAELGWLTAPAIPNIGHWFRAYVIADLARMLYEIESADVPEPSRRFFMLVFASIIRSASNADPVPVSGLEVTSHMKSRDAAGRVVNPFMLFDRAAKRSIRDMGSFFEARDGTMHSSVFNADATDLPPAILQRDVAAVITSPPYHGAVDYYRRHQLEMYWLRLVADHQERLGLLQAYIGRTKVAARHPYVQAELDLPEQESVVETEMRRVDSRRADAFRHYCVAMDRVFGQLAKVLPEGRPAMFVVGHSVWRGSALNTSDLFAALARPHFEMEAVLEYPVRNRYMSYARHNGASIDREYVLMLKRTAVAGD